jgi:hypothetical protein
MLKKIALAALVLIFIQPNLYACRYTVREIGFADFGADSYQLYLFQDDRISEADAELFKKISNAALLDANISAGLFDVQGEDSLGLLQHYKADSNGTLPSAVLVSPTKSSRIFVFEKNQDFMESMWTLLEHVVASPTRDKLLQAIVPSYAVVLFIEGSDKDENKKARDEMENAVEQIRLIMHDMPKAASHPPEIIHLKQSEIANEKVLLWSLGWQESDAQHPAVAIMYGRGRLMGGLLRADEIKQHYIENMLRYVGADCECGLDRSWMLGTMIPMRWDTQRQSEVLKYYNFDAEHPMVISEMSQILSVVPNNKNAAEATKLYGYSEGEIELEPSLQDRDVATDSESSSSILKNSILLIIAAFFVVLLVGGGLLWRAGRKNE